MARSVLGRFPVMNLFTYGSLMFPEVWLRVAGRAFPSQLATLADYAAYRVRGETYPGLAASPGQVTSGVVYLGVDEEAVARLDEFEGAYYERRALTASLPDGAPLDVSAYVVVATFRSTLEDALWDVEEFRVRHLASFMGPWRP